MRARSRAGRIALSSAFVAAVGVACLAPTQVTLRVVTDVDCTKIASHKIAIYSGDPGTSEPIAVTGTCSPQGSVHEVGSLVLIPSGDVDTPIDVTVIAGVDDAATDCTKKDPTKCIGARRRLRFVPSEPLELPMELALVCQGKVCEPDRTCFRGECVTIDVVRAKGSRCVGPECDARTGGSLDASTADATIPSDGSNASDVAKPTDEPPLHVARTQLPRGLSLAGGDVWWTEPDPSSQARTVIARASMSGANATAIEVRNESAVLHGIQVEGPNIYCAATSSNMCALVMTANPGDVAAPVACGASSPFTGIARTGSLTYVVGPDGVQEAGVSFSPGGTPGAYAEPDGTLVVYATGFGIAGWEPATGLAVDSVDLKASMRGIAVTPTHWLASTATGQVWARRRSPTAVNPRLIADSFTELEDIAWDESTKTLYAAGAINGRRGIYKVPNLAELFP